MPTRKSRAGSGTTSTRWSPVHAPLTSGVSFIEVFVASGYARLVATCWKSGRPSRRVRLTCWVATVEGLITPSVMAVHIRSASVEPSGTASPPV